MKKVLAVASGGGHWIQLLRLRPAFEGNRLRFMTTDPGFAKDIEEPIYVVNDANMNEKFQALLLLIRVIWVMIRYRPDVVITTGAAPGFFALMIGRLFGAKTIWIDSIANAEVLSKSGQMAKKVAHVWLTQWEHLATDEGPRFKGKVI